MELKFKPIFFDSMGAKSMCTLIEYGRKILIDPGIAIMHPSYPAPLSEKEEAYNRGFMKIVSAMRDAEIVVITHYHHDHYLWFNPRLYLGKTLLAKDPNIYINDSQRRRAERFYRELYMNVGVDVFLEEPVEVEYRDPLETLEHVENLDFGGYESRRKELLLKGKEWFYERVERWKKYLRIREVESGNLKVKFPDGSTLELEGFRIKFTQPMFHGIEYSRLGWVIGLTVEAGGCKILVTSDVNGPIIEDYAYWVIDEKPDVVILDGPMTYMLGYTMNMINFKRALKNAERIVEESGAKLVIYDHHLPREPKFRERTRQVWEKAEKLGVKMMTAAEYLGLEPHVLRFQKQNLE